MTYLYKLDTLHCLNLRTKLCKPTPTYQIKYLKCYIKYTENNGCKIWAFGQPPTIYFNDNGFKVHLKLNIVHPVLMGPEKFWIGKFLNKPNFTGFSGGKT